MVVLSGFTWIDNPRSGGGSYATDGPSSILLHMTVSMGLSASYVAGHPYPPHFWANPYTGDRWQTISPDRSAFALYQPSVSNSWTNKKGYTLQTELVGVPEVNVETYTDAHCRWIGEQVVAPQAAWLASVGRPVDLTQVAYRSDSSGSASEYWWGRMGEAEWDSFNGLCQHSVVPYNDHWDCSCERLDRIAAYARAALGGAPLGPAATDDLWSFLMTNDELTNKINAIFNLGEACFRQLGNFDPNMADAGSWSNSVAYRTKHTLDQLNVIQPLLEACFRQLGNFDPNPQDAKSWAESVAYRTKVLVDHIDGADPAAALSVEEALKVATPAQLVAELNAKFGK